MSSSLEQGLENGQTTSRGAESTYRLDLTFPLDVAVDDIKGPLVGDALQESGEHCPVMAGRIAQLTLLHNLQRYRGSRHERWESQLCETLTCNSQL